VLSNHSIVSSSRTVRPCSPWGGRWVGHWRTTWSTVCSSAPHSQAAEEAIPHLYRQEWKRPAPVWRWLSRTHAGLGRAIPEWWVPLSGMKVRSLAVLSNHSAPYSIGDLARALVSNLFWRVTSISGKCGFDDKSKLQVYLMWKNMTIFTYKNWESDLWIKQRDETKTKLTALDQQLSWSVFIEIA